MLPVSQPDMYNFSSLKNKRIGVVGATGAVGIEFLKIFEKAKISSKNISLFASVRSAGKIVDYQNDRLTIKELTYHSFESLDIVFFSAGSSLSKKYRDAVSQAGAILIDNSSAFRQEKNIPLIIPEINACDIKKDSMLIANPNCSTIIMLMGIFPIHKFFPVKKIVVSTYQAASGAGWAAMDELKQSTYAFLNNKSFQSKIFPFSYAFNLFSHNSEIDDSGYCEEEIKMIQETQKILHDSNIKVIPTCIRVPVLRAHSESIHLTFQEKVPSTSELFECFKKFSGITIIDDREKNHFPMPLEASDRYECLVGRIRGNDSYDNESIQFFIAGDQLLKGAALNAVQIAALL